MTVSGPLTHLFHPTHAGHFSVSMRTGLRHLDAVLGTLDGRPATGVGPEQAAKPVADVDLDRPLGGAPDKALEEALEELRRIWLTDATWFHEPRYAAHLNCPVVVPALVADLLASSVNTSMDTFDQSVAATFMERHLIDWTTGRIGFGEAADGIFTSGGTQSNLQALLLARDRAVERGVDPRRLRVLASVDGHFSVQKAARILGLPADAVVGVAVDVDRRMDPGDLDRTLDALGGRGLVPMAVVATAGTTDFGAIDPLPAIAARCRRHDTWLHVDAAYGGGLLASTTLRDRLDGIAHADSVTVDFHKTWFQPVSCSALLVADGAELGRVTWYADYLNPAGHDDEPRAHQVDKTLQTTRRFDALKLWLTLRVMGADQIGDYLDAVVALTDRAAAAVRDRPDLELAAPPQLSTLVLRFRPPGTSAALSDALVEPIRSDLYDRGLAMVASTKVDGHGWLKLTLLNPMATPADIAGVLDAVVASGRELAGTTR